MNERAERFIKILERFKYPLLVLTLGVLMMLIPGNSRDKLSCDQSEGAQISRILSQTKGVGEAEVLISDSGVVVVCGGADKAEVRLEIISAIRSYTGYGSDKITILKTAD